MNTKIIMGALLLVASWARAADLSQVPQLRATKEQRDARLQWFRDAKFGMFIHWGPCSVGAKEIGWGRNANRPWDINGVQTPRTEDPVYDNYYKQFNPTTQRSATTTLWPARIKKTLSAHMPMPAPSTG